MSTRWPVGRVLIVLYVFLAVTVLVWLFPASIFQPQIWQLPTKLALIALSLCMACTIFYIHLHTLPGDFFTEPVDSVIACLCGGFLWLFLGVYVRYEAMRPFVTQIIVFGFSAAFFVAAIVLQRNKRLNTGVENTL